VGGFAKVLRAELMKMRWPMMILVLAVGPGLALLMTSSPSRGAGFESYYMGVVTIYGWIFYPIVSGIFAALICRAEHLNGGWKQLLALPVRRRDVYTAKYAIVSVLLGVSQLLVLAELYAVSRHAGFADVPWASVGLGLLGGWIAVLPLAALQMWASTRWRTFGGPLALNVVLTFPAIFAVQSERFAPWYPWGLPVVGMMDPFAGKAGEGWIAFAPATLLIVIVGGFALWFIGGLVHFTRGDVVG